jgi:hypothetical protein
MPTSAAPAPIPGRQRSRQRENLGGKMTRFLRTTRILLATMAAALALVLPAAAPAHAAGPRNCTELTGRDIDRVGCWELVWVDDVEYRMTFANVQFKGKVPSDRLGNFYVIGPQDDTPQSEDATFVHDHTVAGTPQQNHGSYRVHLRGIFVLCSAAGLESGACVATLSPLEGLGTLPLATTVNGQMLTSVEAIEAAAEAGLVTLLDTGAVLVGTISGK